MPNDLPPNIRALLAEKYPPMPRAFAALSDAMRSATPAFEAAAKQMTEGMTKMNRLLRQARTCRLCGCPAGQHWRGCPLERK